MKSLLSAAVFDFVPIWPYVSIDKRIDDNNSLGIEY